MSLLSSDLVRNRFLGFLIWHSIQSSAIFLFFQIFFLIPFFSTFTLLPSLEASFFFLIFHVSLLIFSLSVSLSSSPMPCSAASPWELTLSVLRFLLVPGPTSSLADSRRRANVSLSLVFFVSVSALSGFLAAVSLGGSRSLGDAFSGTAGLRGLSHGLLYGLYYVFKRRWVLAFPIIQRPLFFCFKMGIPGATEQALKYSSVAYMISGFLVMFLPENFQSWIPFGEFIRKQIIYYFGTFVVFLSWELCHHLYQVLHTRRFIFAPPKGSAAAETNPSKYLLEALEESCPKSLPQYLAYLDLCMICENNVDTWRRAAFFEETGETYKRVVAACLRPLEAFASSLAGSLDNSCPDKMLQLPNQLRSPADFIPESKFYEPFNDFQLCVWCARAVSSLTAHSKKEDRFGVAQLSGSNSAVITTLISCLLAVEALLGKKNILHSSPNPPNASWFSPIAPGKGFIVGKKKGGFLQRRAYAMADVMRTSLYCIVCAFHDDLRSGKGAEGWIAATKPIYGSREVVLQKLGSFLDFQAC